MSKKTDNTPNTQGPWFVWNDGVYAGTPTEKTSGKLVGHTAQICTVDADDSGMTEEQAEAILFLLAAAPDMFKALTLVLPVLEWMRSKTPRHPSDDSLDLLQIVKVALAKAEGGAA